MAIDRRFFRDCIVPSITVVVLLGTLVFNYMIQVENNRKDITLKQYEVTFIEKQKSYALLIQQMDNTFFSAQAKDKELFYINMIKTRSSYFALEPFIPKEKHKEIYETVMDFQQLCINIIEDKESSINYDDMQQRLRGKLISILF